MCATKNMQRLQKWKKHKIALLTSQLRRTIKMRKRVEERLKTCKAAKIRNYKKLQTQLRIFHKALTDLAENGTRHQLTPTVGGTIKAPDDYTGWSRYVQSIDTQVRHVAQEALDSAIAITDHTVCSNLSSKKYARRLQQKQATLGSLAG